MNKNTSGFIRKGCLAGIVCLSLFLSGCASSARSGFETVAGYLESGGSYYRISDNRETFLLCEKVFRSFEKSLLNGPENGDKMLACALYELIFRQLGLFECRWSGASSVRIPDAVETVYRNRYFWLLPEKNSGLLWQMSGKKNRPLLKELAGLPADAVFAGDFDMDLRPLGKRLIQSKFLNPDAEVLCRKFFKAGLEELFEDMSGEWGIVFFPAANENDFDFVVTLPDQKKRIFNAVSRIVKNMPGSRCDQDTISFNVPAVGENVFLNGGDGRLTFFSGKEAKDKFLSDKSRLAGQPDFKRLSNGMPDGGVGVFYSAGPQPETKRIVLPSVLGGGSIDPADFDRPELLVIKREKNGLSARAHSGLDVPSSEIAAFVFIPMAAVLTYWDHLLPYVSNLFMPEKSENEKVKVSAAAENVSQEQCRKNMQKLSTALQKYAAQNKTIPAEMGIPGLRRLVDACLIDLKDLVCPATSNQPAVNADLLDPFSCGYVYFGMWKKSAHAKLPVVIDVPRNHSGAFHVLFNDGSIAFLSLENCTSIKRIAGFLHTKFNYGEEEFRDLIKRISQLEDTAR